MELRKFIESALQAIAEGVKTAQSAVDGGVEIVPDVKDSEASARLGVGSLSKVDFSLLVAPDQDHKQLHVIATTAQNLASKLDFSVPIRYLGKK